jgi:hypothetical protein
VLLAVIAACEIGFWVLLAAGLVARYLLRRPKAGLVLLAAVPLVDVVMLVASILDIHRGGEPGFKHSLAAIFIGLSVGFGHQSLKWADKWAAHHFGGAPRPVKPPKKGPERARRERAGWYRHLLSYGAIRAKRSRSDPSDGTAGPKERPMRASMPASSPAVDAVASGPMAATTPSRARLHGQ